MAGGKTRRRSDDWTSRKLRWVGAIVLDKAVTPMASRLAYVLADKYWNASTGRCDPGLETLRDLFGLDEKTIRRAITNLAETGYLTWQRGGRGRSNRYFLSFDDRTRKSDQTSYDRAQMPDQKDDTGTGMTGHLSPDDWTSTGTKMSNEPYMNPTDEPSSAGGAMPRPASEGRSTESSKVVARTQKRAPVGAPRVVHKKKDQVQHPSTGELCAVHDAGDDWVSIAAPASPSLETFNYDPQTGELFAEEEDACPF